MEDFFSIRLIKHWISTSELIAALDAGESSDHMSNLIIGAAVIVLMIFAGVILRRPKS